MDDCCMTPKLWMKYSASERKSGLLGCFGPVYLKGASLSVIVSHLQQSVWILRGVQAAEGAANGLESF
jgi:hypothetical protein